MSMSRPLTARRTGGQALPTAAPMPGRLARPRLYEQIVHQLQEHIRTQGLAPGQKLPPERELAHALGVSRATLAQALVALEVVGLVEVRHGEGATILRVPVSDDHLLDAIRRQRDAMPDVIDAREALESKLAALAAIRRTEEDLAAIDAAVESMEQQIARGERGLEGDKAFHEAVTRAGHSAILERLMEEIRELVLQTRIDSLSVPGRPQQSVEMHREIAEAIRRQDPQAAAAAMAEHIEVVSDVVTGRHTPTPEENHGRP